jgi:hypothetical protein
MSATVTSVPVSTKRANKATKSTTEKTPSKAKRSDLEEEAALQRFKDLMLKNAGKCSFDGYID